jgi:hypothetical protein
MFKLWLASLSWLLLASIAPGQATPPGKMWPATSHDFGSVPRGAQLLHRFAWTNTESRPLEIVESRVSCGCATVTATPRILQPGQSGTLDVAVDARRFVGAKTVTVQLLLGPESPIGITLQINATSRQDVVFNPGQIQFGYLKEGATATQTLDIEYAGPLDYRIDSVNAPPHLKAEIEPIYKKPGQIGHRLKVTLQPTAPAGDLRQIVQLKTNDSQNPVLDVLVEAAIRSDVSVIPLPVHFGTVTIGQKLQRRVTLRGTEAFKILKADSSLAGVTINFALTASKVHSVQVQWQPQDEHDILQEIVLHTDLPKHPIMRIPLQGSAAK